MTDEFKKKQEAIETWLREVVQVYKMRKRLAEGVEGLKLCDPIDWVQVSAETIEALALYLGLTLTYIPDGGSYGRNRIGKIEAYYKGGSDHSPLGHGKGRACLFGHLRSLRREDKKPDRFCPGCGEKLEL